jgi:formylmethanofuran dehydrogenase subunit C
MIDLTPTKEFKLPVIAECISPDIFREKTLQEIAALKVWEGNKQKPLSDFFKIAEFDTDDQQRNDRITIRGDLTRVREIGSHMKSGEILIQGNVGMHLGAEMHGGKITVYGNAGGWVGSMMKNSTIEIHGNAGDYLASPYRGSTRGMDKGRILVHGNVGNEAGACMKDGAIKILGSAGQFLGLRMRGGTVYVKNSCKGRAGACMSGGKIIIGGAVESILPSFTIDSMKKKTKVEEGEDAEGPFYVFLGDLAENGNGKLYVSKTNNPQLNPYEKLL